MKHILHNSIKTEGKIIDKADFHESNLEIAFQNIDDLNLRWNNTKEVVYVSEKNRFEPSDYTDSSNYSVVDLLNKYISWNVKTGKDRDFHIKTYLRYIQNRFDELHTELHYRKLTNELNEGEKQAVKDFIRQYRSFAPIGLLTEKEENQIRTLCDQYCDELTLSFLCDEIVEAEASASNFTLNHQNVANQNLNDARFSFAQILNKYFRVKSKDTLWQG